MKRTPNLSRLSSKRVNAFSSGRVMDGVRRFLFEDFFVLVVFSLVKMEFFHEKNNFLFYFFYVFDRSFFHD